MRKQNKWEEIGMIRQGSDRPAFPVDFPASPEANGFPGQDDQHTLLGEPVKQVTQYILPAEERGAGTNQEHQENIYGDEQDTIAIEHK